MSGALIAAYGVLGAWPLGFVMLVPLLLLPKPAGWRAALGRGWALSVILTLAGFAWFGLAVGRYLGTPEWVGLLLLLLGAPLFQPQCLAWALARWRLPAALAAAVWVAVEWAVPKLLGDTLGHGLYPADRLRQGAELFGAAGLTLLLLAVNEGVAAAWRQRRLLPLLTLLPVLLLAGFGHARWTAAQPAGTPLRVGLIQADQDPEALRRELGSGAALRALLDTHLAMSYDAVERQGAQLLIWSETVYPLSFGQAKSAEGAAFDAELLATVRAASVPLLFGTFQRDGGGEYNAAVLIDPKAGVVGAYRKTHLFPLTERTPDWLPGARFGRWQPGDGARLLPVGELPVQVLICRDGIDPQLALDGAQLGARLLAVLSNDRWFSPDAHHPTGARLHLQQSAFRSIETRLPQARVTHNGLSALIDARGAVLAQAGAGERGLVVGTLTLPHEPPLTLMRVLGDWVGAAALGLLALALLVAGLRRWQPVPRPVPAEPPLPPRLRLAVRGLQTVARLGLAALGLMLLLDEQLRLQSPQLLRWFAALVLLPEAAAACLRRAGGAPLLPRTALRLAHPALKFGLLPLLLAVPAFHLHQRIAYGHPWGEALAFGWPAWWSALGLWWGGWLLLVLLAAAVWRAVVEGGSLLARQWRPQQAALWRLRLEALGLALLYLGLPLGLAVRIAA